MDRTDHRTYDALVVGGGPAGAISALMLARAGWKVAVVEKALFPRRKVCGDFVSAPALSILDELSLQREFLAAAGPEIRQLALFEGNNAIDVPMPKAPTFPFGRALGREHLDSLLLDAAVRAGAKLWQPWQVKSFENRNRLWLCCIRNRRNIQDLRAELVIIATGSHRPETGRNADSGHDLLAFKAYYRDCRLPGDWMSLLVFPGGYGGIVNSSNGLVSLSCCVERRFLSRFRLPGQRAGDGVHQHILRSSPAVRDMLGGAALDGQWLALGPIRPGIRKAYAEGAFFVGNAAGEPHPIVAEGISMAIQSAWLLCKGLISSGSNLSAAGTREVGYDFQAEWSSAFASRISAAALFAWLALHPAATTVTRPVMKSFPKLLRLGAIFSGKSRICVPSVLP
jgi:flavin-dependent dehydrogenase